MSNQIYPSLARTASFVGDDNRKVPGSRGLMAVFDVTVVPGIETVTLVIEGKDPASGKYWTLLQGAARLTVGTDTLKISPGLTIAANVVANDIIPDTYRARVVHSAGSSFTYSVSLIELP